MSECVEYGIPREEQEGPMHEESTRFCDKKHFTSLDIQQAHKNCARNF